MSSAPASSSPSSAAPSEPPLEPPPARASAAQRAALRALAASLQCTLCEGLARTPVTLGCGHFFCQECINDYSENHWECPGKNLGALWRSAGCERGHRLFSA